MTWYNSNIWIQEKNVQQMVFPDGAVNIELPPLHDYVTTVTAVIKSSDDVMALLLVTDALKREGFIISETTLEIPYFPYSRQDRVCNPGEALSLAVMAGIINSLGYFSVTVFDPQ